MSTQADSGSTPRRVLVADDDRAMRFRIRSALEQDGWTVDEAGDGDSACELVERLDPDIVLLDVDMPGTNGIDACAHLRALPNGRQIPVLMITGLDDQESITRSYDVGATDFLSKPFNLTVLRQRLQYMRRSLQATRELEAERDFVSTVVDTSMALVLILDTTGRVVRFNKSCERVSGLSQDHVKGESVWELLVSPDERDRERLGFERLVSERGTSQFEGAWTTQDGNRHEISWSNSVLLNRDGEVEHVVCTGLDITDRNRAEERVRYLASYDPMTGLPNRRLITERLAQAIAVAETDGLGLAVLFIDLDRFGKINATWGHQAGDQLLTGVAQRLSKSLRLSDLLARHGPGLRGELGRPGGDEFSALLTGVREASDVAGVIERLHSALRRPFVIEGQDITITASIGAAIFPGDGADGQSLLTNAESAMQAASEDKSRSYHFYSAAMHTSVSARLALEAELRHAVDRGQFELHYQAKALTTTRLLAGTEALVRWRHPDRGLVLPATFIEVAEDTGLIVPIGEWVLRQACEQVMKWLDMGLQPVPVAVNLSSAQFHLEDLLGSIASILNETAMDTHYLAVEVTESMIMRDILEARAVLTRLNQLGVRVAIDDFGTGYSTLSSLQDLPVHSLKIDQTFIQNLTENTKNLSIARAIITMAHGMGLTVVAEGVESEGQLELLQQEGCDEVQGYLIGRPVPHEEFAVLLQDAESGTTASMTTLAPITG